MARKKGKKVVVKLDLPKDDTTMIKLYAILAVSLFIGLACFGFWLTNSSFLKSPNGSPLFVNLVCGYNPNEVPTFADNETCDLMKDAPNSIVWEEEEWTNFRSQGKMFDVPGVDEIRSGGYQPAQPLVATCDIDSQQNIPYEFSIRGSDSIPVPGGTHEGNSGLETDQCIVEIPDLPPGDLYQVVIISKTGDVIDSASFKLDLTFYDGVPEYMNNGSIWIGPKYELGGFQIHPTIFLNFFGLSLFFIFWPASFYWDRVKANINAIEEKFPDFLRDMAEYWKGGLSMTVAVQTLAGSEYGALNDEVKKMSDQLSWGVAFSDVIGMFAERVGTPIVKRAISLISEANRAGGKISDILVTAANDSREIKFLEGERVRAIASYISVIWVSYLVFMGVIVVLSKVFIPAIASSNSGGESESIGNMQINAVDPLFFLVVFFYGVSAQAVGNGAMAGLMATGRLSNGMKHSGFMLILALLAFNFVAFTPDLIGVPMAEGLVHSIGRTAPG